MILRARTENSREHRKDHTIPRIALIVAILLSVAPNPLPAQGPLHVIEGQVTDPGGGAVSGAKVEINDTAGQVRTTTTDTQGKYRVGSLPAGDYTVRITAAGFARFESPAVTLAAGLTQTVNTRLTILRQSQDLTVSDRQTQFSVDPSQSVSQIVLRGDDLDSFSDDAEDLTNELQMLAGPSPGPDGPQIFIDGFSGGIMPAKASIREIRVNQNPFSTEYDRVGFGRIEVFTKPGSDLFHGQGSFDFGNRALTARNPFLTSPIVPGYRQEIFAGNFGGPLSKHASFFIDADRRLTDENAIANYTTLDSAFLPQQVSSAVVAPSHRFSVGPRLDYAITPNQTLTLHYSIVETNASNQGLVAQSFDLPSQAYSSGNRQQSVQVSESAVLGTQALNDIRYQFLQNRVTQTGVSTAPEIEVVGAFTGGGTFPSNFSNDNRSELQESLTLLRGTQTIKAARASAARAFDAAIHLKFQRNIHIYRQRGQRLRNWGLRAKPNAGGGGAFAGGDRESGIRTLGVSNHYRCSASLGEPVRCRSLDSGRLDAATEPVFERRIAVRNTERYPGSRRLRPAAGTRLGPRRQTSGESTNGSAGGCGVLL